MWLGSVPGSMELEVAYINHIITKVVSINNINIPLAINEEYLSILSETNVTLMFCGEWRVS